MREEFKTSLKILWITYISLFIVLLDKCVIFELFNESNLILNFFNKINFESLIGQSSLVFFIMFFFMNFFITKSKMNEVIIYEDDNIENKIEQRLILYKVLIIVSIIIGGYCSLNTKNNDIIFISIYLIIVSILIHYSKRGYCISYMYDRKLQWQKQISNEEIYNDTHKWRLKQKFNGIVYVDKRYRFRQILQYIPTIFISLIFMILGSLLIKITMGYLLIVNIMSIIEYLFNLHTFISGTCTSVTENRGRHSIIYRIVVTDYEKKVEKKFAINDLFNISEMDRVEVVYGIFSKRCIMVNNVVNKPRKYTGSYVLLFILLLNLGIYFKDYYLAKKYFENAYNEENYYDEVYNDYYEDDDPYKKFDEYDKDLIFTNQEISYLYDTVDKNTLDYAILEPNEYYVESTFNTFEHYDGMVDRQIVDDKKFGKILYHFGYDSLVQNTTIHKETALYLINKILPDDIVEERILNNKEYGIECRVYKSSKGTFVVRMGQNQYFNGEEPYYNENEIVDITYLKLIEE